MKLTISPSWVRWVLIIVSGGLAALAALSLVSILLNSGTPGLFPFASLLVAFLLNGSICIFSFQQEGPLKPLLYTSGSLSLLSGVLGFLSLLIHPAAQPVGAYMQSASMLGIGVATFWVAISCVKAGAEHRG